MSMPLKSAFSIVFACFLSLSFAMELSAQESTQEVILKRIEKSKKDLSRLESEIGAESRKLAKRLSEQQNTVMSLRTQAAEAQRIRDEQLLSLETIKNRVEKWEVQSVYQKHLLRAFVEATSLNTDEVKPSSTAALEFAMKHLKERLNPSWKQSEIIAPSGDIFSASVLSLGPSEVFYKADSQAADTVIRDSQNNVNAAKVFSDQQEVFTKTLFEDGRGYFVFDPSLGSALKLQQQGEGMYSHVSKGGVWAVPIVFFGLLSLTFAVIKGLHLWRLPKVDPLLFEKIEKLIGTHSAKSADGGNSDKLVQYAQSKNKAQAELVKIATNHEVSTHRDELLMAFLLEYRHKLDKFLGVVATSAAVAPLLGLLGTVSGMISTFKLMTIFGSGDASTVSGGISEALVTTELGLIVAIPSLIASALLARTAKSYNHKLESFAIKLSKLDFK